MRSRGFELPESPFGPPDVYDPALRGQRSRNAGQRIAPQDEPLGTTEDHYRKRLEAFVRSGKDVRKPETTRSMKALRARVRAMRDYNRFVRWTEKDMQDLDTILGELLAYRGLFFRDYNRERNSHRTGEE